MPPSRPERRETASSEAHGSSGRERSAASLPRTAQRTSVAKRRSETRSEPRRLAAGAAGLFLVSLTLLHWGWYQHDLILDTVEYHRYGSAIVDGQVPYRDFRVEYPPGALPAFALPAVGKPGFDRFNSDFQILMGLCAAGALLAMAYALQALRAPPARPAGAL